MFFFGPGNLSTGQIVVMIILGLIVCRSCMPCGVPSSTGPAPQRVVHTIGCG